MRLLLLFFVLAASLSAAEELPSGERWLPETLPDYLSVTVFDRPCDSRRHPAEIWMIRVRADTEHLDIENFYLLPYLWDRKSGELLMFSDSLVSEARNSIHGIDFSFHPRILDQVVVSVSINSRKHIILASDFFEGQRCK